jgi:hypothetical protein
MMRSVQNCRRSPSNFRSWRKQALFALRVVLFALAFQFSGFAGALEIAAEVCAGEASECPLEKQGKECPPRCPQCHCPHANGLAAPSGELVLVGAAVGVRVGLEHAAPTFVGSPVRSNPYRPPRSA